MKRHFRFAIANFRSTLSSSASLPEAQLFLAEMFVEDEDESTRARGGGQLPKFGAVEEKIDW